MAKYLIKKLLNLILVLVVASIGIFTLVKISGMNPVLATLGGGHLSEEALAERMERYGLDKPVVVQYLYWLKNIVVGNFGESVKYKVPVIKLIKTYCIPTIYISVISFVIAQILGVLLGIWSAVKKNHITDKIISAITVFFFSVPVFFLGMLIILYISKNFPNIAFTGSLKTKADYVERLSLPIVIMAIHQIALVTRVTRSSMIEQLSSEYIITLRAKGLPERVIIYKHALKNGIIPVMTIAAMQFGSLIVGAVLVESIFSLNGLGQLLVQAVLVGDTAVIQGVSIIVIVVFQLANLVVDALYAVIDPRIRQEQVA